MEKLNFKALSIRQPYAQLIVEGKKKIELRNWETKFRGEFFIHASKNADLEAIKRFGLDIKNIKLGGIIGKVNLIDVKNYKNEIDYVKDEKLHLSNKNFWNFGFVLENPKSINFIPTKGNLNFFNVNLNLDLLK